jgi:predicted Rossmann-fold nucleotide-binding protein
MNFSSKLINDEFNMLVIIRKIILRISKFLHLKPSVVILEQAKPKTKIFNTNFIQYAAELVIKFGIITGGGPGLMEAAKEERRNFGSSAGVNMRVIFGIKYLDRDKDIRFNTSLFVRYV